MKEEVIGVEGMNCQHCVNKIKQFVGDVKGVSSIEVDLAAKSVRVCFEPPASLEAIKEAILDSGFEVA